MTDIKVELTREQLLIIKDWAYDEFENQQEQLANYPDDEYAKNRSVLADDLLSRLNTALYNLESSSE